METLHIECVLKCSLSPSLSCPLPPYGMPSTMMFLPHHRPIIVEPAWPWTKICESFQFFRCFVMEVKTQMRYFSRVGIAWCTPSAGDGLMYPKCWGKPAWHTPNAGDSLMDPKCWGWPSVPQMLGKAWYAPNAGDSIMDAKCWVWPSVPPMLGTAWCTPNAGDSLMYPK